MSVKVYHSESDLETALNGASSVNQIGFKGRDFWAEGVGLPDIPGYSIAAQEVFAIYATLGDGLTDQEKDSIATYIDAEIAAGNQDKKDHEFLFGLSGSNALVDYVGELVCSLVGGPTASTEGFILNGVDQYISLNVNLATDSVNYLLDSAEIGYFLESKAPDDSANCYIGVQDATVNRVQFYDSGAGTSATAINSQTRLQAIQNFESNNYYSIYREDNLDIITTVNGNEISTDNVVSTVVPNVELLLGAFNANGSVSSFADTTISSLTISSPL